MCIRDSIWGMDWSRRHLRSRISILLLMTNPHSTHFLSYSLRSQIWHESHWAKVKVSQYQFLLVAPGENLLLPFLASEGHLHSLACGPFPIFKAFKYQSLSLSFFSASLALLSLFLSSTGSTQFAILYVCVLGLSPLLFWKLHFFFFFHYILSFILWQFSPLFP